MTTQTSVPPTATEPVGRAVATRPKTAPSPTFFSGWSDEDVDLIRRTIAPDATDHELALYLRLCKTYGLDPFRKELVMEKRKRKRADGTGYDIVPVFITTRDGYLKVAMADKNYAGLIGGVVCEGDQFEYIAHEFRVNHRFGTKRGQIIGAWAIAYHKERPPMVGYVPFREYNQSESPTWQRTPSAMIHKVAETFVLRRQFNISGIVGHEEIEPEPSNGDDNTPSGSRPRARSKNVPDTPPVPTGVPALPGPTDGATPSVIDTTTRPVEPAVTDRAPDTSATNSANVSGDSAGGATPPEQITLTEPSTATDEPTAASPSVDEEPEVLTPDEAAALRDVMKQAAQAEGMTGPGATLRWVTKHFGIKNGKLEDVSPEIRAQIRKTALRVLETHEAAANAHAASLSAPAAPAASGKAPSGNSAVTNGAARHEDIERISEWFRGRGFQTPAESPEMAQLLRGATIATWNDLTPEQATRTLRFMEIMGANVTRTAPPA